VLPLDKPIENFYKAAGVMIGAVGTLLGISLESYTLLLAIPFGVIIVGIGDIIKLLRARH